MYTQYCDIDGVQHVHMRHRLCCDAMILSTYAS